MTTRREPRHQQPKRARVRWTVAVPIVALLAGVLTVASPPGTASAAVPRVAQTWSSLMYHSLTPSPEYVQLRKTLAAQRSSLTARIAQVTQGRATQAAAQIGLAPAVTADAAARTRYAGAREALGTATNTLTVVSLQRPHNAAAVAAAKQAVAAASATAGTYRAQAGQTGTALKSVLTTARTATTNLDNAIVAWQTAHARVVASHQKLVELDKKMAGYAGQAAAISRTVVTEIRPRFVYADSTTVYGVRVHKNVAYAFRRMLDDAKASGIVLSGGGFRTKQRQIELRKINGCPDIWTAPASSCRVPTAIPGRSLHEIGLAVDITSGGRSLTANSPAFKWMAAYARRYGFVNLPSEPWHWSITGG
ncbi:M15 family metallopeptidase [Jidongwangia harbinensis]|uniref:M15 family metallopeptidase n=1 Tax=Jidongwangia harbinensis TaxID=2878561 RepID=UPI001CD929A7|nr:M15 family metallopeptidase [Jidongwangia harbinensis]MCA2212050.1 M15 family metallopeptidase [Jidongwangia harbinensis]